jgi:hypothetical protein
VGVSSSIFGSPANALTWIKASGIEPVGVNLANPDRKEGFVHTRNAHGIVIQACSDFELCG